MTKITTLILVMILTTSTVSLCVAAEPKQKSSANVHSQEIIGRIVAIDLDKSTLDLEYEIDDQTNEAKKETFFITEATTIDVATVKSGLKDLKVGSSVLLEYAQMPDGAKVAESVWVKKS
jgi:hypothetical protein